MSIEDIILAQDKRGISALRSHLPPDYCMQAARFILNHPGPVLIATGFSIPMAQATETDGPLGALVIGHALTALGQRVVYISDRETTSLLTHLASPDAEILDFPITDAEASRHYATEILAQLKPALVIAIERCGLTQSGAYLNMRGRDISATTARIDELFFQHPHTIGIGDGGNEIGMGNLAAYIPSVDSLPDQPATTCTTHLIIASVANWGAYGLVTALSNLTGRHLLPDPQAEVALIRQAVDVGAVDGTTAARTYTVDGFDLEANAAVLEQLHRLLAQQPDCPTER
jgi:Domain of unknown function (DUF4392)